MAHRTRTRIKGLIAASTVTATLCAGAATLASGAVSSGGGGATAPPSPKAKDNICLSSCLALRTAAVGGKVEISGRNLDFVSKVKFRRSGGGRVGVTPLRTSARRVTVKVPKRSRSGRVKVVDEFGGASRVDQRLRVRPPDAVSDPGPFKLMEAGSRPRKIYFFGKRRARLDYLFRAESPTDIRVDVVSRSDGALVRSFTRADLEPYATHTILWDGTGNDGRPVPNGRYRFMVGPAGNPSAGGGSAETNVRVFSHIFPLRAKHSYGDGLGAGRGHNGQDVFARCGKPVVAAQGGKIVARKYHRAAGYYMVIEGRATKNDYVYMHLARKGRPPLGRTVKTGQRIGYNSDTGNASGCHVHFELWSAPGWYEGGNRLNPTPKLRAWDKYS